MSELLERAIDVTALKNAGKEAEWHALRKTCITGSAAASLLGQGFNTPYEAYKNYQTDWKPWEETPEMIRGKLMEGGLLEAYRKRCGLVLTNELFIRHPEHEWLGVTVDALACDIGDDFSESPVRVVEAKTAGQFVADQWFPGEAREPVVPYSYEIQAMLEMACCDLPQCDVVVFIEAEGLFYITIHRDKEREQELIEKLRVLWFEHIKPGVPPPMTEEEVLGVAADKPSTEEFVDAPVDIIKAVSKYKVFGDAEKENAGFKKKEWAIICNAVGGSAGFILPDGSKVKVARETRSSVNIEAAQKAIDERFDDLFSRGFPAGDRIKIESFRTVSPPFFKIYMPKTGKKKGEKDAV